jgi:sulfur-oxidizing protein SoxB
MGRRIDDMRLRGKPIEAGKTYKVAGWAPVAQEASHQNLPMVWDLVEKWLRAQGGRVKPRQLNAPAIKGGLPNAGYAA